MWFAALDKLRSIRVAVPDAEPSPRHFDHAIHHDLESLIWVATYSLYRRAYEVARHPLSGADELEQEVVEDALNADFGNADAAVVTLRRQAMASRGLSGLYSMLHYFDAPLRDFVLGLMDRVHAQNRHDLPPLPHMAPETMEELLTCEGLKQYIVSYIAEHFTPPDDAQRR
ncbi:hypothetical protein PsYK624_040930 [Phanerochaete sordida]|uniref:Uncharacterized protein n=1 Tax=Phanerochaete sordida TaxID=48140 RepID=A0A9P3G542_9APHY|nr:hypothetical protein PsYK624_040930 [Phanerochaete sordida]